jgi:hypothetical protein
MEEQRKKDAFLGGAERDSDQESAIRVAEGHSSHHWETPEGWIVEVLRGLEDMKVQPLWGRYLGL